MKKMIFFLFLSCSFLPASALLRNLINYDHGFTEQEALEINRSPQALIKHIEQAEEKGLVDAFNWTRILEYNEKEKPAIKLHNPFSSHLIIQKGTNIIKNGDYIYIPFGFKFMNAAGFLVLGIKDPAKMLEVLNHQYAQHIQAANQSKLDEMNAEKECVVQFIKKLCAFKKNQDNNNKN